MAFVCPCRDLERTHHLTPGVSLGFGEGGGGRVLSGQGPAAVSSLCPQFSSSTIHELPKSAPSPGSQWVARLASVLFPRLSKPRPSGSRNAKGGKSETGCWRWSRAAGGSFNGAASVSADANSSAEARVWFSERARASRGLLLPLGPQASRQRGVAPVLEWNRQAFFSFPRSHFG